MDDFENDWRKYIFRKRYELSKQREVILLERELTRSHSDLQKSDLIRQTGHDHR